MAKNKYLLRLDDACDTMDFQKWNRIESIFDKYGIKPLVGVIPNNKDPQQIIDEKHNDFWDMVNSWIQKGWDIAMHGYDHCYVTKEGGMNPLWNRSEFAGLSLAEQNHKIKNGIEIFHAHNINPEYFFAPSHTFDFNTLEALKINSDIRIISDTIATKPYKKAGFIFIPQLGGYCREMKIPGIWTFCLHPSAMTNEDFLKLEDFLSRHKSEFISFKDLQLKNVKNKSLLGRLLSFAYFTKRRISR